MNPALHLLEKQPVMQIILGITLPLLKHAHLPVSRICIIFTEIIKLGDIQIKFYDNVLFVVTCLALSLAHGNIQYTESLLENGGYPAGTMASFTCEENYFLVGSDSNVCKPVGTWNGFSASCGIYLST